MTKSKELVEGKAIIITCEDNEGTYAWVAPSIERAKEFVKENLSEVYGYDGDVELFADGEWCDIAGVRYMLGFLEIV